MGVIPYNKYTTSSYENININVTGWQHNTNTPVHLLVHSIDMWISSTLQNALMLYVYTPILRPSCLIPDINMNAFILNSNSCIHIPSITDNAGVLSPQTSYSVGCGPSSVIMTVNLHYNWIGGVWLRWRG